MIARIPLLIFLLLTFFCSGTSDESRYLPDSLPSEESLKETLANEDHLRVLNEKASSLGFSLQKWKDSEKQFVTDREINVYWNSEKKQLRTNFPDTDSIDRLRESIRMRLVWSRIFQKANIQIKQKPIHQNQTQFLTKLDLKSSPQFGNAQSRWVIIEWSDYLCGFCKDTFPHTKKILKQYQNQVFYVHKDYPLDGDSIESLAPLVVSRCLWEKDPIHFTDHMLVLYKHAKSMIHGEPLPVFSSDLLAECDSKREVGKYLNLVKKDWEEAKKLGVTSIPTFWVNGKWIVGALNEETWKKVLKDTDR